MIFLKDEQLAITFDWKNASRQLACSIVGRTNKKEFMGCPPGSLIITSIYIDGDEATLTIVSVDGELVKGFPNIVLYESFDFEALKLESRENGSTDDSNDDV